MTNHLRLRRQLLSTLVTASLFPTLVSASGFALIENNARGQGNAYAGAAAYTPDASTIFFNPAGMTALEGDQVVVAGHYILPDSTFVNQGSTAASAFASTPFESLDGDEDNGGSNAVVPNFYWVKQIDEASRFGVGITAPFGLATRYDDDWVGRYHAIESDLKIINFNPSYAYKLNEDFSVGVGLDIMMGEVSLSSAIDFGALCFGLQSQSICTADGLLPQQADGYANLEGDNHDDIATGYNLGLTYKIAPKTTFGLAYRSEVDIEMEGEADFQVPANAGFAYAYGLFIDSGLSAEVTLPDSLSLSLAHESGRLIYLVDITKTGWSSFDELRVVYDSDTQPDSVTTEDWEDTMRYSFGIDYQYNDETVYRFGLAYDESPVPSAERRTPRLPGTDRTWLSLGMSKQLEKGMSIDIGYSHLFMDNVEIDNEFESSVPTLAANLSGEYDASVDIFSVQLTWQY